MDLLINLVSLSQGNPLANKRPNHLSIDIKLFKNLK